MVNRTFVNFNKADCIGLREFIEDTFTALPIPTDVIVGERQLCKVIAAATKAVVLANKFDKLQMRLLVDHHKWKKWVEHSKSCNLSAEVSKLWTTLKLLFIPRRRGVEIQFAFSIFFQLARL